jgi:hypothetical protein
LNRRKEKDNHHHDIIDLTGITNSSATTTEAKYVCKECLPTQGEQLLMPYPKQSPYAGPSYKCPSCDTVYDSSLMKLPRAAKPVRPTIGSERNAMQ